jgi:hypothetical protein
MTSLGQALQWMPVAESKTCNHQVNIMSGLQFLIDNTGARLIGEGYSIVGASGGCERGELIYKNRITEIGPDAVALSLVQMIPNHLLKIPVYRAAEMLRN